MFNFASKFLILLFVGNDKQSLQPSALPNFNVKVLIGRYDLQVLYGWNSVN